jgi:hypothetical protein
MGEKKEKDLQPPYQKEREGFSGSDIVDGTAKPGKSEIEAITEEAGYRDSDGILRQTLRGDESEGDPDDRDVAGATASEDTPQGREETKNNKSGAANQNG